MHRLGQFSQLKQTLSKPNKLSHSGLSVIISPKHPELFSVVETSEPSSEQSTKKQNDRSETLTDSEASGRSDLITQGISINKSIDRLEPLTTSQTIDTPTDRSELTPHGTSIDKTIDRSDLPPAGLPIDNRPDKSNLPTESVESDMMNHKSRRSSSVIPVDHSQNNSMITYSEVPKDTNWNKNRKRTGKLEDILNDNVDTHCTNLTFIFNHKRKASDNTDESRKCPKKLENKHDKKTTLFKKNSIGVVDKTEIEAYRE